MHTKWQSRRNNEIVEFDFKAVIIQLTLLWTRYATHL